MFQHKDFSFSQRMCRVVAMFLTQLLQDVQLFSLVQYMMKLTIVILWQNVTNNYFIHPRQIYQMLNSLAQGTVTVSEWFSSLCSWANCLTATTLFPNTVLENKQKEIAQKINKPSTTTCTIHSNAKFYCPNFFRTAMRIFSKGSTNGKTQ